MELAFKRYAYFYLFTGKYTWKSSDVQWNHTTDIQAADRNIVIIVIPADQLSTDAKKQIKKG